MRFLAEKTVYLGAFRMQASNAEPSQLFLESPANISFRMRFQEHDIEHWKDLIEYY